MPPPPSAVQRVVAALLEAVAERGGSAAGAGQSRLYDAGTVPRIPLAEYLARWARYTETGDAEVVCAAVYIDRACTGAGVQLTERNVHRLTLAALLAATKYREERPFKMSYYARIGGVEQVELLRLETRFIQDVDWRLGIDADMMERYVEKFRAHPEWAPAGAPRRQSHSPDIALNHQNSRHSDRSIVACRG